MVAVLEQVAITVVCRVCRKPIAETDGVVVRADRRDGGYMETAFEAVLRCHRTLFSGGAWRACGTLNRVRPGETVGT